MSSDLIEKWMTEAGCTMIKPSGENLISLCPFHEDHHRSFSMNTQTGKYICFSESCGEYGGVLSFLLNACDYTFKRAKKAAIRFGALTEQAKYDDVSVDLPAWGARRKIILEDTVMEEKHLGLYDFCPTYMVQRGFDKKTLREWEVGFDYEANRVTIPVRDHMGRLVGMTKRAIDDAWPKYLHLNFKKSKILYGEHKSSNRVPVWVGEGQIDALALWSLLGVNVVSTMGARVGNEQIQRLKQYPKVILAFDNDDDGVSATLRTGDVLTAAGKKEVFVADRYPPGLDDPSDLMQHGNLGQVMEFHRNLTPYSLWVLDKR